MESGSCTACCYAFPVVELGKGPMTECKHADGGCLIYEDRPQSCRECFCAWVTQPAASENLLPDKCGVIFEKISDDKMSATRVGAVTAVVEGQLRAFKAQGYKVGWRLQVIQKT